MDHVEFHKRMKDAFGDSFPYDFCADIFYEKGTKLYNIPVTWYGSYNGAPKYKLWAHEKNFRWVIVNISELEIDKKREIITACVDSRNTVFYKQGGQNEQAQ